MKNIAAIVLAAGQSTRMGAQNKLLATWHGRVLVEHVCAAADESNCRSTIVVTGHEHSRVADALAGQSVVFTHNAEFKTGMASSIRTGIRCTQADDNEAAIILLGDMPQITSAMIDEIIGVAQAGGEETIVVSTCRGERGNPLLWPRRYFKALVDLRGDVGARQMFARFEDKIVEVELGPAARFDLDTPEAFKSAGGP